MQKVRSFIALQLTPQLHQQLGQIQNSLKKSGADVKWVNPEGIHLTLKFLGEVSPQLLEEIKKLIDALAQAHKGFKLRITKLGAFPTIEHPRVIWVGIEEGSAQAVKLAQDLEERLVHLGFLKEKRTFQAHLTLGRVRSAHQREQLTKLLSNVTFSQTAIPVETLTLFKSTLTPQGAIYVPLYEVKLS